MTISFLLAAAATIIGTAAMNMASKEAETWLGALPLLLLKLARARVRPDLRQVLYEEWTAELFAATHEHGERPLSRLWLGTRYAAGILRTAPKISGAIGHARHTEPEPEPAVSRHIEDRSPATLTQSLSLVVPSQQHLGTRHKAKLLMLMAADSIPISNRQLRMQFGNTLNGAERMHLNQLGLVMTHKHGPDLLHELTDSGWAWCAAELQATTSPSGDKPSSSADAALHALTAAIGRYMNDHALSVTDIFATSAKAQAQRPPACPHCELEGASEPRHRAKAVARRPSYSKMEDLPPWSTRDELFEHLQGCRMAELKAITISLGVAISPQSTKAHLADTIVRYVVDAKVTFERARNG